MNYYIQIYQRKHHFSEFSDYQEVDARIKTEGFFTECSIESVKFSVRTSMTEIKAIVTAKHEFQNRDKTLLVELFGCFGFS